MEIIPEGRRFRLVNDDELPSILKVLEKHLPYSLKVRLQKLSESTFCSSVKASKIMRDEKRTSRFDDSAIFLPSHDVDIK